MEITGYMIDVEWDGDTLLVHGRNKAARIALAGEDHARDVVLADDEIAAVDLKDASMLVNGTLEIKTTAGKKYRLHFRRKQREDFHFLASQLGPAR